MDGKSHWFIKPSRACDPCAARKIRCDRGAPCRRCKSLSLACTTLRKFGKPGPRGPWAHRKRRGRKSAGDLDDVGERGVLEEADEKEEEWRPDVTPVSNLLVPVETLAGYLRTYNAELYGVWPVINVDETIKRLEEGDEEAYALSAAVSAVTIAQLNLSTTGDGPFDSDRSLAAEAERVRVAIQYQERPTLTVLLSSYFLHVFSANRGQMCKATLFLREAITFAQLLGLDDSRHYEDLSPAERQLHLRAIWLLYMTERGHTTRFDLKRILKLDPDLPPPAADSTQPHCLRTFSSLCRLFMIFGRAMDSAKEERTPEFFIAADAELRSETRRYLLSSRELQSADFLITQQWMRIVLWKIAMFSVLFKAEPDPDRGEILSISFPERIARNISSYIDIFPRKAIEAHGIGIKMKVTEVAISLADMLLCTPSASPNRQTMQTTRAQLLDYIASFLLSCANVGNPRLAILRDKLSNYLLTRMPLPLDVDSCLIEMSSARNTEEGDTALAWSETMSNI